ncbi:MAG: ATP-dependent helicase [Cellulomonas sp. 14-74-6]|nr:MAG: ATP-dependent helicase [Cellulomonas sp. 14-74-6]
MPDACNASTARRSPSVVSTDPRYARAVRGCRLGEWPVVSGPDEHERGAERPRRRGAGRPDRHAGQDGRRHGDRDRGQRDRPDQRGARRRERVAQLRAQVVLPPVTYPEELPVSARRAEIAATIADHQVVVVAGETGSGKTTQLPKILLELGRGRAGQIGHTQPRRIAARTVAERVADELGVPLGGVVGYQVRFTDESSDHTLVKVMTDGILLAQIQRDPQLLAYDTIVVDEAHERSLNIDFILGYLTRLLPQRPDLKLVITSATIDSERFASHFAAADGTPAPIVEVTGRTYPVELRYRPLSPDRAAEESALGAGDEDDDDGADDRTAAASRRTGAGSGAGGGRRGAGRGKGSAPAAARRPRAEAKDLVTGIVEAVDELMSAGPGDVLVFLSGEREIRDAEDGLRGALGPRVTDPQHPQAVELLPLYARLSAAEQRRVFEPHGKRRVILATNVAETSLTVPGVRYVVDPGTARISRYSQATKVQRLPIEPISQASANQRSGRSGRVAPGIAVRLYSADDLASRPEYTEPEILRTSLASVILQMIAVGVVRTPDEVAQFPFVDPPDVRAVRDGVALLTELGALSAGPGGTRLTDTGRALAQLPIDPRLARMIVEAGRRDVAREVVVIAAALSIQDPRERPADQREVADALHRRFVDPSSDLLTYLNLWQWLREQRHALSGSAFRRLVRSEHLNYLRVREWQDVVTQLRDMVKALGIDARGGPRPVGDGVPGGAKDGAGDGRGARGRGGVVRDGGRRLPPGAVVAEQTPTAGSASEGGDVAAASAGRSATSAAADVATSSSAAVEVVERTTWAWDGDRIHLAVLAGLLSQIGMQEATEVTPAARSGRNAPPQGRGRPRPRNEYLGARNARFAIFPGSGLARRPPAWVMAAELVETSRLWARDVARIRPEWAEELAGHLVRRSYSEPAWSTRQGAAMVTEKVTLYGVPIVTDRRILLGSVDREQARELFIRHALVQGEWTTHHTFFHENRRLLAEAQALEARARRRDLVVDDDVLFDFYDERVPDDVVSARHFDTWWKGARRSQPELLAFTRDLLVAPGAQQIDESAFPSRWPQGDVSMPLTYQFEPGTEADGVTVHIPLVTLARLRPEGFDWMVPGLRAELVTATIRALPKPVRVQLVPAPDVARAVDAWMDEHLASWEDTVRAGDAAPSFHEAFAQAVRAMRDVEVPADAFDDEKLPAHLRMTFRVVDAGGGVLDEGKDLVALQRRLAGDAQDAVSSAVRTAVAAALAEARAGTGQPDRGGRARGRAGDARAGRSAAGTIPPVDGSASGTAPGGARAATTAGASTSGPGRPGSSTDGLATPLPGGDLERSGLRTWPDLPDRAGEPAGMLPDQVSTTAVGGVVVRACPSLVELPGTPPSVGVRLLADAGAVPGEHRRGLRRLLLLDVGLATARVSSRWTGTQALALAASPYRDTAALVTDVQLAAIDRLITRHLAATAAGAAPEAAVRDAAAYTALRTAVRDRLEDEVHRLVGDLVAVLTAWREVQAAVRASSSLALLGTARDVRDQADALVHDGFVSQVGADRLPQLTRYLRAAAYRLTKAAENPQRDESLAAQVREVQGLYRDTVTRTAGRPPDAVRTAALDEVRWMLEELRVSLFAQQLGTPVPVSTTRIRKALAAIV